MGHSIILDFFEGPLDLLLHLIKNNKIQIGEVKIVNITNQYLDYLEKMESFNIDIASEFLIMAATLIKIKSDSLIAKNQVDKEDLLDEEKLLLERVALYEKFKILSEKMNVFSEKQSYSYFRPRDEILYNRIGRFVNPLENIKVDDLLELYVYSCARRKESTLPNYEVKKKKMTLQEKINTILNVLEFKKSVYFNDLEAIDKGEMALYFLAILDLYKDEKAILSQNSNFHPIKIIGK